MGLNHQGWGLQFETQGYPLLRAQAGSLYAQASAIEISDDTGPALFEGDIDQRSQLVTIMSA
jgi:hypothetical protein